MITIHFKCRCGHLDSGHVHKDDTPEEKEAYVAWRTQDPCTTCIEAELAHIPTPKPFTLTGQNTSETTLPVPRRGRPKKHAVTLPVPRRGGVKKNTNPEPLPKRTASEPQFYQIESDIC